MTKKETTTGDELDDAPDVKIDFECSGCGAKDYIKNVLATEDGDLDVLICQYCGLVHDESDIITDEKPYERYENDNEPTDTQLMQREEERSNEEEMRAEGRAVQDETPKLKGVLVNVYRGGSDSTNYGISGKFGLFILVGKGVPEVHEVTEKTPALKLVRRMIDGEEYLHVEPVDPVPEGNVGYMMGGNFVYSPDTRFRDINDYPLPVHDRSESVEMHKLLSM